jgi:hypothetical protein
MIFFGNIGWWYWAATDTFLFLGLSGRPDFFYAAVASSLASAVHFALRERSISAFPVQVRIAYISILFLALQPPLHPLFWLPAIGTLIMVLFGYCLLARILSLLPWNRRGPLSWHAVRRTFFSKPVEGRVCRPAAERDGQRVVTPIFATVKSFNRRESCMMQMLAVSVPAWLAG